MIPPRPAASCSPRWESSTRIPWRRGAHRQWRARAFGGYAGWGGGQLESEIRQDAWIDAEPLPADVFTDDPSALWSTVLGRVGGSYRLMASAPDDPLLN